MIVNLCTFQLLTALGTSTLLLHSFKQTYRTAMGSSESVSIANKGVEDIEERTTTFLKKYVDKWLLETILPQC